MDARLLRVSVVAGHRRVDLAVPGAVPVAELLPDLARSVGLLDPSRAYAGHRLLTTDGRALATGVGLSGQGVPDGAVLTVVEGVVPPPPKVYDDPAEAVTDAVAALPAWSPGARVAIARAAGALLLLLGAVATLLAGDPRAAVAVAAALCTAAVTLSRVRTDAGSAAVAASLAASYAAVAGALLVPAPARLAGAGAGALAVGLVGAGCFTAGRALTFPSVLVGAVLLGVGLGGRSLGADHSPPLLLGALVVVVLAAGAMPHLAAAAVRTEDEGVDVHLAHELLLGVTVAVGVLLVLSAPVAAARGAPDALLVADAAALVGLRARHVRSVPQAVTAWAASATAAAVLGVVGMACHPAWRPVLATVLVLAGATTLLGALLPEGSLRRAHAADVAEPLVVIALLPLLVVVVGLPTRAAGLVP